MSTPGEALYYRNVHPDWIAGQNRPTSQAFRPTPKDNNRLSVDDATLTTPEESFRRGNEPPRQSLGILSITHAECQTHGLTITPDPTPDNPAHALITFPPMPHQQVRRISQALRNISEKRGWLYRPDNT